MEGGSRELQCVGKLEIARPKPVGFLCGSIPVPTDKAFHSFSSALIPSRQTFSGAPRYRMLPTETDLNSPPHIPNMPEGGVAVQSPPDGDSPLDVGTVTSNLTRKCEALAVSGVAEYGDEIDVIGPADILKQIFKIPYSKARLSIAVQRIGRTLILNPGPDVEEGEKFRRRHNNQTKSADQSLFLNFAMHSVRVEACDCPPAHHVPAQESSNSSVLPGLNTPQVLKKRDDVVQHDKSNPSGYAQFTHDGLFWGSKKNKRNKNPDPLKKGGSQVGEKPRSTMQGSEKHKRASDDGFLRVLFWQFHNFRMLLGSDLMLFSNEKYVAVSLHLWDVSTKITPLTWLEAWLDNVMASVPELAICYHQNGVVQGYELIKTDDIFLLKGISEDGTPAFHPYVVQQNGLSVLRFIQENCKQEPGAYWLYKSAGEDVIQLFDLSVISKNHSSSDCDDCSSSMPSIVHKGRSDSLHSLGTLLYRIAHRLSLSMAPDKRAKCATFIKKCLEFLDEPDHLVVRAFAHEQYARLILNYEENLELTSEAFPVEYEVIFCNVEEEESYILSNASDVDCDSFSSVVIENSSFEVGKNSEDLVKDFAIKMSLEANASYSGAVIESGTIESGDSKGVAPKSCEDERCTVRELSPTTANVVQTVADPISSKLAAIHHVSQAIKSLRWMRQLQRTKSEMEEKDSEIPDTPVLSMNLSVCACGDPDCIEVCDIREWLPTSKLDHRLWKLVLLLGESYLALGRAYKEAGQLHQALKVVELACSVYGSMPQQLKDSRFISSLIGCSLSQEKFRYKNEKAGAYDGDANHCISNSNNRLPLEEFSSVYLFWAKAWTLVGDIFVENYMVKGNEISKEERKPSAKELKVSSEIVEEVTRLKKRLGQYMHNCSSCSLVNCSCQSDRANSGSSASSRTGDTRSSAFSRKQKKKLSAKSKTCSILDDHEDFYRYRKMENRQTLDHADLQQNNGAGSVTDDAGVLSVKSLETSSSKKGDDDLGKHELGSSTSSPCDIATREKSKDNGGGIFKYLRGPLVGDVEYLLSVALSCYKEARKALSGLSAGSEELQSVMKKLGWVCNEVGRYRLATKELNKAEVAFADAIKAFREVSDHTNIILINCNLGHGRRALAEAVVSKIEDLKLHGIHRSSYNQALDTVKLEYSESLRYYSAAKSELNVMGEESGAVSSSLRTEIYTQFAHTYLRLGMFLAREDTSTEVYGNGIWEDENAHYRNPCNRKARKDTQRHEISANDAIREALSTYESLGDLRKQEAAYAHFQLACYQRDCCLKFLELGNTTKGSSSKAESNALQRAKQYALLAERNWQKGADFYSPETHNTMYLTILMERSALLLNLSNVLHSNTMLESAVSHMLEGCKLAEPSFNSLKVDCPELHSKFWGQLQTILKKMLAAAISVGGNKPMASQAAPSTNVSGDSEKLRELYGMSLKSSSFSQLNAIYALWAS